MKTIFKAMMISSALVASLASAQAPAVGYKEASLGMTLSSFKEIQLSSDWRSFFDARMKPQIACSDEDKDITPPKHAAEIRCRVVVKDGFHSTPAVVSLNEKRNFHGHDFLFVKVDSEFFLYRIDMSISPDTFETVLNVFSKKYGSFSQTKSTLQNGFGARFEQVQAVWSKKGQVIQIKRFEDRENGSVIMVDEKLHAVVLKQAKVATPGI